MDWFKKHTDTVIILAGILSSVIWMNGKFNQLEREVIVVKTVLIMKGIMPPELAIHSHAKESKEG